MFSAVAFMVIGAVTATLLLGVGRQPSAASGSTGGTVDIGFAQDMVVHHHQAVTMAQTVRGRVSPSVDQLAAAIELNQTREIGQMQGWLALWDAPQVASGPPMTWMAADHHEHQPAAGDAKGTKGEMPGLASVDEMDRLGDLKGKDLDAWFLQLMIRHHQGGLLMTTAAIRKATNRHVRALATLMTVEQRQDNATMSGLLAVLGRKPLPAPA